MRLRGMVAVVTGAGAGLGRAVALRYAAEGAQVVGFSYHAHELEEVATEARLRGLTLETVAGDVSDPGAVAELADLINRRFGHVDVLVNNAGVIVVKPLGETPIAEWDRVLAVNLRGPFLCCRALVPLMREHGGTIINVSSASGVRGFIGEVAYCPSKFGLEGLTASLALELAPWNIRVVTIHPGVGIRTPMSMTTYDEEARRTWRDPEEIAPAFVVLATHDGPAISGERYDAYALSRRPEAVL